MSIFSRKSYSFSRGVSTLREWVVAGFTWARENVWIVLIAIVVLVNLGLAYYHFLAPTPADVPEVTPPVVSGPPAGRAASLLNGEYILEELIHLRPFAVMIDHFVDARPPAGLTHASIIWETLAEGGVTRLMPIFQTSEEVVIGPVRSARDYFLPWAQEVGAIYVHSGGSPAGLAALAAQQEVADADEFRNGSAYYRAPGVAAPHNLFTSMSRLTGLAERRGWVEGASPTPWVVSDEVPKGEAVSRLRVDFSAPTYRVEWAYDEATGLYRRSVAGVVAADRNTKQQLTTKNVIVLLADITPAPRPGALDAVSVKSVDAGEAWFLRDGVLTKGRWEKTAASARVTFTTNTGEPYAIARGQVWVQVVPRAKANVVLGSELSF